MPATLPALPPITVSSTAKAVDVWDMFWECTDFLNGSIDFTSHVDFGTPKDEDPDSKNLKPYKIAWDVSVGHTHAASETSGPISSSGLFKKHIDLNSAKVCWVDMWNDIPDEHRFVVFAGVVTTHEPPDNDYGFQRLPVTPYGATQNDLYTVVGDDSARDTSWDNADYELLGYILNWEASPGSPSDGMVTNISLMAYMPSLGSSVAYAYLTNNTSYHYPIHYLAFFRLRVS